MSHPYPPHLGSFGYVGRFSYSLTFGTDNRLPLFDHDAVVEPALTHILRAAQENMFEVIAYCFMPDHLHLVIGGRDDSSDLKAFVSRAKQYSGHHHLRARGERLWARYCYERVMRDEMELVLSVRYVVANPVRAGLVSDPREYPFLGSMTHTLEDLLQWYEYSIDCAM